MFLEDEERWMVSKNLHMLGLMGLMQNMYLFHKQISLQTRMSLSPLSTSTWTGHTAIQLHFLKL